MKPKTDCFGFIDASYWFEDEYYVKKQYCKALTTLVCKKKECPFYKLKGTEDEVIFHAQGTEDTE